MRNSAIDEEKAREKLQGLLTELKDLNLTDHISLTSEVVAGGGFCDVFKGEVDSSHERLKEMKVAVKMLRPSLQSSLDPLNFM